MKGEKGVSLVELIIVIGLLGIILLIVFIPFTFSLKNFDAQNERSNIISDARYAMDFLTREIRRAQGEVRVEDDTLIIGDVIYRLEDKKLLRGSQEIVKDIDELKIDENDERIDMKIVIKNSKGKEYKLSSSINLR